MIAATMRPRVVAYFGPNHDLYHTSKLMTGLDMLARRDAIELRYDRAGREQDQWLVADPIVVCLDIDAGNARRVAVDLRDGEGFSFPIIDRVDRYLKRAFFPPELPRLAPAQAARAQPFGLNFGCRNTGSTLRLLRTIGVTLATRGYSGLARLRQFLSTPPIRAFEQTPDVPVEPTVMFQTRLWTADEIPPDEVEPLNTMRVAMVRGLRRAFGDRFVGGLVPTPYARAEYPADVTPHSSAYARYLALKKRCLVSVYTRGVEHSLAFKLGETIAASQCLVSVPLRYDLPTPFIRGTNYLLFDTVDEAIAACDRLLSDAALARDMRHANHQYYVREVEPAAHVASVIARSLAC
jgi:hypothetical protein